MTKYSFPLVIHSTDDSDLTGSFVADHARICLAFSFLFR
jgi:hypothetical protein